MHIKKLGKIFKGQNAVSWDLSTAKALSSVPVFYLFFILWKGKKWKRRTRNLGESQKLSEKTPNSSTPFSSMSGLEIQETSRKKTGGKIKRKKKVLWNIFFKTQQWNTVRLLFKILLFLLCFSSSQCSLYNKHFEWNYIILKHTVVCNYNCWILNANITQTRFIVVP